MFKLKYTNRILFLSILITGVALRLYKWNGYSLWFDEIHWVFMRHTRYALLDSLKSTIFIGKPPLFRFLLYFWIYFGQSEFILRLLPFTLSILSILVAYKIAKMLFDEKTGLIVLFLMSLSPFHIYYSQELSHYSLTILLSLCSLYYLIRSLKEDKIYSWIKFVFFTSLSLYANYICLFLVMAENLIFFLSSGIYKKLTKKWLISNLAILLLCFPWLMMLPKQIDILSGYTDFVYWIPNGSLARIFQTLRLFNVGYNANFTVHFFASLLFFPLFLVGIFFNLKRERQKVNFLLLWLFAPMILAILFSKIIPIFTYRNFFFILPAYYLLVALGVSKLKEYIRIFIFSFMILSGLSLYNYYRNILPYPEEFYREGVHAKKDNRGASEYIIDNIKEKDVVVHTCPSTSQPYLHYFFSSEKRAWCSDDLPTEGEGYVLVRHKSDLPRAIENYERCWLVLSYWEPHLLDLDPDMEENKIKKWLDSNLAIIEHKEFTGIKVYLYQI